ncbi:DoxX family protein [Flagellimonas marinaquae]|jgi:putative oxidoreductase|uniref:DoxX family protein n=1 Tax=Flagellimonas marinaquae TaxID=254955 RepID=UPI002074F660|nr:DoxX family protein [Allomuricauda aquimarina]USD24728.1 DoxX family protein [Allomuricauda aquimarina]
MKRNKNVAILLFRVSIPFTMLIYGIDKITNGTGFIGSLLDAYNLPSFFVYGVFIGEIVAPLMLVLGYRSRLAGLLLAFNCLLAILMAQIQHIFTLNQYGGWTLDLLFIYLVAGVAFYFSGAGEHAISTSHAWD